MLNVCFHYKERGRGGGSGKNTLEKEKDKDRDKAEDGSSVTPQSENAQFDGPISPVRFSYVDVNMEKTVRHTSCQ